MADKRRDVILVCRIEAAQPCCSLAPNQAVGADNGIGTGAAAVVENEKVITIPVKPVKIATPPGHFGQRLRAQSLVEYPIAQRLRGIDIRSRFGQPYLQRT